MIINSTPSERLFSTAGDIINAKRACLDPENVSMLCFLAENLPYNLIIVIIIVIIMLMIIRIT